MRDRASRQREEQMLFDRYRRERDPALRDRLVTRYLPLARQLAQRYRRAGEPHDDLVQVASIGLLKAIDRFDPARGVAFSSYAVPTVLGELRRYFRDRTWSVRVPRDLQELSLRVDSVVAELAARGRSPAVAEIADALGVDVERVLEAMEAGSAYRSLSLSAPRGDAEDDGTLADEIGSDETGFAAAEDRATLGKLLLGITPREREILRLRFEEDLSQAEIGARVGVSQMQVSRLLRQSLVRLRAAAE